MQRTTPLTVLRTAGVVLTSAFATLVSTVPAGAQPAQMVADINTTESFGTDNALWQAEFVDLAGTAIFTVDDGVHGNELWRSDGTPAGTVLVKDICPGVCSSYALNLTVVGSLVFFTADDGAHGRELWKSDGTPEGTALVVDLVPGLGWNYPDFFKALGNLLIFSTSDRASGRELWRSDGTAEGTQRIKDILPGPDSSSPELWVTIGSTLYFTATDADHGRELWRTDGSEAGTVLVKDINPNQDGVQAIQNELYPGLAPFAAVGGQLYFAADDGSDGEELWRTDGTEAGTVLVKDIAAGGSSSLPSKMVSFDGDAYFVADDGVHGRELWKSDGSDAGTVLVKDINVGSISADSNPYELTVVGSLLYFHAGEPEHGRELWRTDGTEAGTVLVKDIRPGPDSAFESYLSGFTAVGSRLVFFADDGVDGNEPWSSDGTEAGTNLVRDIHPGAGSSLDPFTLVGADLHTVSGGRWYFRADSGVGGREVWTTDGTTAGTQELEIDDQTSSFFLEWFGNLGGPRLLSDYRGSLLFRAGAVPSDGELWKTDGTTAGTSQVAEVLPGSLGSFPYGMTTVHGRSIFATWNADLEGDPIYLWLTDGTEAGTVPIGGDPPPTAGLACAPTLGGNFYFGESDETGETARLWRSDGTVGGTYQVSDHGPDSYTACPVIGDTLYFVTGGELWRSDGTDTGTQQVIDIGPSGPSSYPDPLVAAGSLLFFSADDGVAGRELWVSDGTAPGTHRVKDILPGPGSGVNPVYERGFQTDTPFAVVGRRIFFAADDGVAGGELWVSDGTEAGTHFVADVFSGPRSSEIRWLTAVGDRVYFVADDGIHGRELWTSDGTERGTHLAADILPGPGSSEPQQLAVFGSVLLFTADDGVHGMEPWRLGADEAPTIVQDLAPGPTPSSPLSFTASGPFVYFAANDGVHGFELWRLRITPFTLFADGFESGDLTAWSAASP
jgi:ELWxxDGT repeat protein